MMQQASPQHPQALGPNLLIGPNHPTGPLPHPGAQAQQTEKLDNISKVKSLIGPLRESLAVSEQSNRLNATK